MKILFLGRTDSIFVKELYGHMAKRYKIDIFDISHLTFNNESIPYPEFFKNKMFKYSIGLFYAYSFLKNKKIKYDVIHILYKKTQYLLLSKILKKLSKKIIITIFGSDFYKNPFKIFDTHIYNICSKITFANPETLNKFNQYYNNEYINKTYLCPFGLNNIEFIKKYKKINKSIIKKELHLTKNDITITCGNNSSPNEQHIKIINELSKFKSSKKITMIFPLTYGSNNKYKQKIILYAKKMIKNHKLIFLEKYLPREIIAKYKLISDININFRKTDQLSGAISEALYANSILITGSWLPYKFYKSQNIIFYTIDKINNLNNLLIKVSNNLTYYKKRIKNNHNYIPAFTSWKILEKEWKNIYEI